MTAAEPSSIPIANHYLHAAMKGAVRQGWKPEQLLQQSGIPISLLNTPEQPITAQQLSQLFRTIWRCTGDENLGFSPQSCPYGSFALMAELVIHSKTLGGMLKQAVRYCSTLREELETGLIQQDGQLVVTLNLRQSQWDTDHTLQELLLLVWQRLISWLVGYKVLPTLTRFNYPTPDHAAEYLLMYGRSIEFDQPSSGFSISDRLLHLPIIRSEHDLKAFMANFPAIILHRPRHGDTIKQQIQQLLLQQDFSAMPTLTMVADHLHLTPRTLRRKLALEGVQYRQLKDQIRRDKAIRLLTRENLSINQVSQHTGFSEPAAFCKAFKKWTGTQPSLYRNRQTKNP
ncbi:MAG: AraC family transcriptional regulator [Motiliproteus sp.]